MTQKQQNNLGKIEVIAFDLFGTIFDLSKTPKSEIVAYARHIRQPEWAPLILPESWEFLPLHPDSRDGVKSLRQRFMVVTCSNAPLGTIAKLSKNNNINWDAIIPLELNMVFKPNPKSYLTVCDVLNIEPSKVLMVTANEKFGDLEGSKAVGMESILIRGKDIPDTIALAELL